MSSFCACRNSFAFNFVHIFIQYSNKIINKIRYYSWNQPIHISVWKYIINIVYLIHVYNRGWIYQDITEVCEPVRGCKVLSFKNSWFKVHTKLQNMDKKFTNFCNFLMYPSFVTHLPNDGHILILTTTSNFSVHSYGSLNSHKLH